MKVWGRGADGHAALVEHDETGGIVHRNLVAAADALAVPALYPEGDDSMTSADVVQFIRALSVLVEVQAKRIKELERAVFPTEMDAA